MDDKNLKRADDSLIAKLIQTISDDRRESWEWREKHDRESREWRNVIEERLRPIEEWVRGANSFWKVIAALTGIGYSVIRLGEWFSRHWK